MNELTGALEFHEVYGPNREVTRPVVDDAGDPIESAEHPASVLQLIRASTLKPTRPTWLWSQRVPCDAVTLLAGREGTGKSALMTEVAALVTRGELSGDLCGTPGDVVYVGTEDDWNSVLVPRLMEADADLERVHLVAMSDGIMFSIDLHLHLLEDALAALERVALVIVDPLDAHLGDRIDSHRKAEVQRTLARLAAVAQQHDAAIVGIGHLNKGDSREVLQRVIGSVGFTTAVRSVIGVGEHPEDQRDRIAVVAKSNLAAVIDVPAVRFRLEAAVVPNSDGGEPIETVRVAWLAEELIDANSILSGLDPQERTERDEAADFLREYLADGPQPSQAAHKAAEEESISRSTLNRAAKSIGVVIVRDTTRKGRPSTWALPPEGSDEGAVVGSSQPASFQSQAPTGEPKSVVNDSGSVHAVWGVTSHQIGVREETTSTVLGSAGTCDRCQTQAPRRVAHHSTGEELCTACCALEYPAAPADRVQDGRAAHLHWLR